MIKKIILIGAGILVVGALGTGAYFGIKSYRNSTTRNQVSSELNDLAKKITVDYENKNEIHASKADIKKIKFSEIDFSTYDVNIKSFKVSRDNSSVIDIVFVVFNKKNKEITSNETKIQIKDFKKILSKEQLEESLKKVTQITYDETKKPLTLVKDINKNIIKFVGIEKDIEANVVKIVAKQLDSSIAVITFNVQEKDGKITSSNKVLELKGFKKIHATSTILPDKPSVEKLKTLEELNEDIEKIQNLNYSDNKSDVESSKIEKAKISPINLAKDLDIIFKKVNVKEEDLSTITVAFTIKQKNGKIESKEKILEISGFKLPKITKNELNKQLEKIKTVKYLADKSNVRIKDIDIRQLIFDVVESGFVVNVISITHKNNEETTAVIKFTTSEKNGIIESSEKFLELEGFKKGFKNLKELDEILSKVKVTFDGDKENSRLTELDKLEIRFDNLEDNFEIADAKKTIKNDNITTLIVTFSIKEKDGIIKSNERSVEIKGFKLKTKTSEEINNDLKKITEIKYLGDLSKTEFKDINSKLIEVEPLDSSYEFIFIELTKSTTRKWVAYLKFKIREKGERTTSGEKVLELTGFKIQNLTTNELNAFAKEVKADYKDKMNVRLKEVNDARNLRNTFFTFTGFDIKRLEVSIISGDFLKSGTLKLNLFLVDRITKVQSDAFAVLIEGFNES